MINGRGRTSSLSLSPSQWEHELARFHVSLILSRLPSTPLVKSPVSSAVLLWSCEKWLCSPWKRRPVLFLSLSVNSDSGVDTTLFSCDSSELQRSHSGTFLFPVPSLNMCGLLQGTFLLNYSRSEITVSYSKSSWHSLLKYSIDYPV